jgi:hypothetical protein
MDRMPNVTDPMPLSGHPMREVRLTPWAPIQEEQASREPQIAAKHAIGLDDKVTLSFRGGRLAGRKGREP